jgi:hypothetical protein
MSEYNASNEDVWQLVLLASLFITRTGAILPQCRSCHSGNKSAPKLNHSKFNDLRQLTTTEIDSHLQKSIAAVLKKEHIRGGAGIKSCTCRFVKSHLTTVQHQFLSEILRTQVFYGHLRDKKLHPLSKAVYFLVAEQTMDMSSFS